MKKVTILMFVAGAMVAVFGASVRCDVLGDMETLARQWLATEDLVRGQHLSGDLTGDGIVNMFDFAMLVGQPSDHQTATGEVAESADELAYLPGGVFEMGDSLGDGWADEQPVHAVTVDPVRMGKCEVTNGQYCEFLNSALGQGLIVVSDGVVYQVGQGQEYPYCDTSSASVYSQITFAAGLFSVRTKGDRDMADDPMVEVCWYGAAAYCNWRSVQEGFKQCYDPATWRCDFGRDGYRLPTEAEWEHAARGGTQGQRFAWGDSITHEQANYWSYASHAYDVSATRGYHPMWSDSIEPYTSPAGSFAANEFGLYDMAGNVWEWCNDWYSSTVYQPRSADNPTGPASGLHRVIRGGCWDSGASTCRVAFRYGWSGLYPGFRSHSGGFRIVRCPDFSGEFVLIPSGTFEMGDSFSEGDMDERPVHTVTEDSFFMGKYEITNQQYCDYLNSVNGQGLIAVSGGVVYKADSGTSYPYCDTSTSYIGSQIAYNGSVFSIRVKGGRSMANDPMVCVTWYGAVAYCNWRSQQEDYEECYDLSTWFCDVAKKGYRLATEAEWEYGARGGFNGKRFPWGDTIRHSQANYYSYWQEGHPYSSYDVSLTRGYHPTWDDGVGPYTSPVGSFAGNGFGLHDMAGNVDDWCNDWYGSYSSGTQTNPTGPSSGTYRVLRGGDYLYTAHNCRVAYRRHCGPDNRGIDLGFRVILTTKVLVPTVVDLARPNAEEAITAAGLVVGAVSVEFSDTVLEGCVISQTPLAGQTVLAGSTVSLIVSKGPGEIIPDDMVLIPSGTFDMGDNLGEGYSNELPVHMVIVDSFYMGKYEVTNQQYCDFLNSAKGQGLITMTRGIVYKAGSGTSFPYCGIWVTEIDEWLRSQILYSDSTFSVRAKHGRSMVNDPVVSVTWYGAVAYCNWRSQQKGKEVCYDLSTWNCDSSKKGYRLATEAEWEYAARGGLNGKRFPWGDTITHSQANYYSHSYYSYDTSPTRGFHPTWNDGTEPYTSPSGSLAANGYGLCDIAGNVWEWCNDWWSDSYYSTSPSSNPTGPSSGTWRVLRGGCWFMDASRCRVTMRIFHRPDGRGNTIGFRVALDSE